VRKTGSLNGSAVTGSTMLVAGGGFCVGVSRAALKAAGLEVGDEAAVQLRRAGTRPASGQVNSVSPQCWPGRTPGGQAKTALPTWWVYSLSAS
jgi:Domain of unknown function (DUF1905)